jgi:Uncharacterized protein conserved in bacteria (DUF2252)
MNIVKSTARFEEWLGKQTRLLADDLESKHQQMAERPFAFLRATFYRWAQRWPEDAKRWADAPVVPSVGDLHIENFGTWRDADGRLVWGINDFDEAYDLPFTNDLVRLATSALLAADGDRLGLNGSEICDALIAGYRAGLDDPVPFVLAENHAWLGAVAMEQLRNPARFWVRLNQCPVMKPSKTDITSGAIESLQSLLPKSIVTNKAYRHLRRTAGLGSLGKVRIVALADWQGGYIARETKALTPSACVWALDKSSSKIHYDRVMNGAVRCIDPLVRTTGGWIVRRLAPDCSKIDLASLPRTGDVSRLIEAMGRETANVHVAAGKSVLKDVRKDLKSRGRRWLDKAAQVMVEGVQKDWQVWHDAVADR